ncbi:MAG: HNH endonuclease, partial [Asgard group archaeon]
MVRNDIIKNLKARFGDKCYLCGAEGVPLSIHHIVPLSEGGDDSLENLRLVCLRCHLETRKGIREFDFVSYLFQLLQLNRQFRNVRTQERFGIGSDFVADLVDEEKINDQWQEIVIE